MESVDELFEQAKRLKPEELSKLVVRLEEHLASIEENSHKSRSFARMLALSGIIQIEAMYPRIKRSISLKFMPRGGSEASIHRYEWLLRTPDC
jgi:hypothetical protein